MSQTKYYNSGIKSYKVEIIEVVAKDQVKVKVVEGQNIIEKLKNKIESRVHNIYELTDEADY